MSVLAHAAASMGERGATQALAYILNQQPGIVRGFVNLLSPAGVAFDPQHHIQAERGNDGNRPDMTIYDMGDPPRRRVLVENKFSAELQPGQPVCYLNMLPEDVGSGLLFIVPSDRVRQIWSELKRRCANRGLDLEREAEEARVRWVPVGDRTMLITDWQNVLDALEGAADGQEIRCDLLQFRRLVERLEGLEAFLPLHEEEIGDVSVPQRIINYMELLNSICARLPDAMGINYGGPGLDVTNYKSIHRRLTQNGHDVGWLAISFHVWHRSGGTTPLWWWMAPGFTPDARTFNEIESRIDGVYVSDVMGPVQDGNKFIPIRLTLGVEREQVVEDAIQQIQVIRGMFG